MPRKTIAMLETELKIVADSRNTFRQLLVREEAKSQALSEQIKIYKDLQSFLEPASYAISVLTDALAHSIQSIRSR